MDEGECAGADLFPAPLYSVPAANRVAARCVERRVSRGLDCRRLLGASESMIMIMAVRISSLDPMQKDVRRKWGGNTECQGYGATCRGVVRASESVTSLGMASTARRNQDK